MVATLIGRRLSRMQCDMLIDHIDQVRPITRCSPGLNEDSTRNSLITKKLIRYVQSENVVGRPKGTELTRFGREVVCAVLAADIERYILAAEKYHHDMTWQEMIDHFRKRNQPIHIDLTEY